MATFVQEGDTIDYTPGSAVVAGTVVVTGSVGIGVVPVGLAANEKGSLVVDGVVRHAKAAGGVTAYAKVYWDATNSVFTTTATSNTLAGYAVAAAASGDATVDVKLMKS
jgi:hypothetical protein